MKMYHPVSKNSVWKAANAHKICQIDIKNRIGQKRPEKTN